MLGLHWKLHSELVRPREQLAEAAIVDVSDPSHLEIEVVDDEVVHVRAVAAPETGAKQTLLTGVALDCVEDLLVLIQDLDLHVGTGEEVAGPTPASHAEGT